MSNIYYIAPLVLVIVSNILYHLLSKNTPTQGNTFAALMATYGVAFLGSAILFFLTRKESFVAMFSQVKLGNFIMGLVIIGVEGGYLLMYQKGWEISKGSLSANICIAIILFIIGILFFRETVSLKRIIGLIICIIGIIVINTK
ncbi:MAG: transporter [Eubacterium sp.]|nr:transporter [Eubacterium sp.]